MKMLGFWSWLNPKENVAEIQKKQKKHPPAENLLAWNGMKPVSVEGLMNLFIHHPKLDRLTFFHPASM